VTTNEPVIAGGAFVGLLQAILAALLAFGVSLTQGQIAAVQGFIVAVGLVVAWLTRSSVTPVAKAPAVTLNGLTISSPSGSVVYPAPTNTASAPAAPPSSTTPPVLPPAA
jgi:hypothetical protein